MHCAPIVGRLRRRWQRKRQAAISDQDGSSLLMPPAARPVAQHRLSEAHRLARSAGMRPHRIVQRDERGAGRAASRDALDRPARHDDGRNLHHLRPPFGEVERLRMRSVVRVAMRAAEEEIVDVELAGLHARRGASEDCRRRRSASAETIPPRGADPRSPRSTCTPSAFTCPARRVSSATSAAAPAPG